MSRFMRLAKAVALLVLGMAETACGGSPDWTVQTSYRTVTLNAVSCTEASRCEAVGFRTSSPTAGLGQVVAERLNESGWSLQRIATPSGTRYSALNGVSCRAGECDSVGGYGLYSPPRLRNLAASLSGGQWTRKNSPSPGENGPFRSAVSAAVSCPSTAECVAVGASGRIDAAQHPFALIFSAGVWKVARAFPRLPFVPQLIRLSGIACRTVGDCLVVGTYSPRGRPASIAFSAHLRSGRWQIIPIRAPATGVDVAVGGVACPGASTCTLVGWYGARVAGSSNFNSPRAFVARFDGARWTTTDTLPVPAGAGGTNLRALACGHEGWCVAVGNTTTRDGTPERPLVERLKAGHWQDESVETENAAEHPFLNAVSCADATDCVAIGLYNDVSGSFILRNRK